MLVQKNVNIFCGEKVMTSIRSSLLVAPEKGSTHRCFVVTIAYSYISSSWLLTSLHISDRRSAPLQKRLCKPLWRIVCHFYKSINGLSVLFFAKKALNFTRIVCRRYRPTCYLEGQVVVKHKFH